MTFELIRLDWKRIDDLNTFNVNESGVYQIYGDSPIYGTNTLLYIGRASKLKNRIIDAHNSNQESFITRQPNISFRYAICDKYKIAEEILIVMHKPSFNSKSIINISIDAREKLFYLQNHGERGMLHLEVTNYYFLNPVHLSQSLYPFSQDPSPDFSALR